MTLAVLPLAGSISHPSGCANATLQGAGRLHMHKDVGGNVEMVSAVRFLRILAFGKNWAAYVDEHFLLLKIRTFQRLFLPYMAIPMA